MLNRSADSAADRGLSRSIKEAIEETLNPLQENFKQEFAETKEIITKGQEAIASRVDEQSAFIMQTLVDEAKESPRLFSFQAVNPGFFDSPKWIKVKFRLTLWCENSRLPLPALNPDEAKKGVYDLDLPSEWLVSQNGSLSEIHYPHLGHGSAYYRFWRQASSRRCHL